MKRMKTAPTVAWLIAAVALVCSVGASAGEKPGGDFWPEFRGPRRDGISPAKGLSKKWPEGGPKLIWKSTECGNGFATVTIAEGMIFTSGDFDRQEMVVALDMAGQLVWKTPNGRSWRGPHPGARTNPTYREGVLYHMNPTGRLAALKAKTGKELWAVDVRERFGAKVPRWALAENVIVDGDVVFCTPGGAKGRIVALNRTTGETLWANTEIAEPAVYCSPILATHNGTRQLITIMQKSVVSVDVTSGELLWSYRHATKYDQNVTSPIFSEGRVFVTSGHGTGGKLLKLAPDSRSITELWVNTDLDNCHGGVLLLDGYLYGSGCRLFRKGLVCVELTGGKTVWNVGSVGKISMIYADGLVYGIDDRCKVSLIEATPTQCNVISQFTIPRKSGKLTLAHPVICGGKLYLRNWNELRVYDIRAVSK